LVITSKNKTSLIPFRSTQFWYAAIYVTITFLALLFLNIYCSRISQDLFCTNKETSMIEKCKLAAAQISNLEALNENTVANAVSDFQDLNVSRLIITDQNGQAIYDSVKRASLDGFYVIFPEIVKALMGNDVFYWSYADGIMRSTAATPVYSYGALIGCVYMMEYDQVQGTLFATLQNNVFTITFILEIVVIFYSIIFANAYSMRLKRFLSSIRTVRKGDYTHSVALGGHDELTDLGDEFNDLTQRLRISEEKRSRFVSDASHELKTPLASIKLLADSILQNEMDMDTVREFVSDIGNEADRLNRMSQKLLALSRKDSQQETTYEVIYIIPTIERVIRMLQNNAAEGNVTIIKDFQCDSPILIMEDDLYQVIFNLIENGIKYNQRGGSLTISLLKDHDSAIIRFTDTGVGIPEESIGHIFERFYRVDKARSRSTGGSGLGLSIVRTIVERNSGKICVSSVLGKGTEFTLEFPIFDTSEDDA